RPGAAHAPRGRPAPTEPVYNLVDTRSRREPPPTFTLDETASVIPPSLLPAFEDASSLVLDEADSVESDTPTLLDGASLKEIDLLAGELQVDPMSIEVSTYPGLETTSEDVDEQDE